MKKNLKLAAGLIFSCLIVTACSKTPEVNSFTAMNTYMTMKSYGSHAKAANQKVQKEIERLETFSLLRLKAVMFIR